MTNHDNDPSISSILHKVAHLLPTQGPIDVFIHHNTLHAFEDLQFEDAVEEAAKVYGAEAFLPEQRYIEYFNTGRILDRDLDKVIKQELALSGSLSGVDTDELVKRYLIVAPAVEGFQEVKWLLRESHEAIKRQGIAPQVLRDWLTEELPSLSILQGINQEAGVSLRSILKSILKQGDNALLKNERTLLWSAALLKTARVFNQDKSPKFSGELDGREQVLAEMINPLVVRFCEEYLDLGFSTQTMPDRREGMLACFLRLVDVAQLGIPPWLQPLRECIASYRIISDLDRPSQVEALIERLLEEGEFKGDARYQIILREALSLRGWAGYVALVEQRPDLLHGQEDTIVPSFAEYISIRLILRLCASQSDLFHAKCAELPSKSADRALMDALYTRAFHILTLFTDRGIAPLLLGDGPEILEFIERLLKIDQIKRRRLWHLAYENNLYVRALDLLALSGCKPTREDGKKAQFVCCIDDREESFRRHIEAQSSGYESFGTAGFFGVDAAYQVMSGVLAPYCPVIIKPTHAIRQVPKEGREGSLSKYRRKQELWFKLSGYVNRSSGSWLHSIILAMAGCFSLVPMLLGVIAPRTWRYIENLLGSEPVIPADLHELQIGIDPSQDGSTMPGYTTDEMATRVIAVLRGIGLIDNFARLVFMIGHGSSSRNNPLRSAYDCGACGGRPGRINSRAFAMMANNTEVRGLVKERSGIIIPQDSYFVGAFHNTCSDRVEYFDLDRVPATNQQLLEEVRGDLEKACNKNALERCRRFVQVGVRSQDRAAEEVLARSYMLAEARPEYGHATNAICLVGPRGLSKELFLDRRAFLVSYDCSIDKDASILLGTLRAVVPVCGGINLEYLFSAVDNEVYGAGTKLPHNIVSLIGIMNGTSSDLRTGLPLQMVEIHEPVRQLLVIVADRWQLDRVIDSDPMIAKNFAGGWMNVALKDPQTGDLFWRNRSGDYVEYKPSSDRIEVVSDTISWCAGRSNHLPFVKIQ